jgi:hypothetical protein
LRAVAVVAGLATCAASALACGGDKNDVAPAPVAASPLPFGLAQVEGTEPIGRPAVYDHALYEQEGVPVEGRSVLAAYRITAEDAPAVLRAWVDRLDGLAVGEVSIYAPGGPGAWLSAMASGGGDSDWADLQLWATEDGPILFVDIDRVGTEGPAAPAVRDEAGNPPAPEPADAGRSDRVAGDVLFTEQGDAIHLPAGTRALMPTIPIPQGTGGSASVLAADDGEAAVRALIDEARSLGPPGAYLEGPELTDTDGVTVVRAGFTITAGGWGFDIVSVEAPDDETATVYVTSSAD